EITAFIVPADDETRLEVDDLRDHLKQGLASYKVPKRWFLVEEIPRTRAGKTDRSPERLFEAATEF
ncbi:MAG TPA: hypothetical protein PLJ64_13040, partial [Solirubrobacterales bacterium]|nr:hypothetical protein [Solirubrobacterales bacterium]